MANRGHYFLDMEAYCGGCPEFEVKVVNEDDSVFCGDILGEVRVLNRTIGCKHQKRCEKMVNYLKKNLAKEQKDEQRSSND